MTIYSDINDVKAMLPFSLNTNSLPTETNAVKIQGHAYRMINGWIGETKTVDDNLKVVETSLVVAQILAIHSKRPFPMRLTKEHKIILDDYIDEELVSVNELKYGFD